MLGLDITHHFGGGVYAKEARIPAGTLATQHVHSFDHLSLLASGRVVVSVEGHGTEYSAPACLKIEAGKAHSVYAMTDAVWFCIHSTEETDPAKVDQGLIA